jgi:hypothetical protein
MFEGFLNDIKRLQNRLQALNGRHAVPLMELFAEEFMLLNTDYPSFARMIEASGFRVDSEEGFAAIPDAEWDAFVVSHTRFASWDEMRRAAAARWVSRLIEER